MNISSFVYVDIYISLFYTVISGDHSEAEHSHYSWDRMRHRDAQIPGTPVTQVTNFYTVAHIFVVPLYGDAYCRLQPPKFFSLLLRFWKFCGHLTKYIKKYVQNILIDH
jgi:hypothetical protein